VGNFFTLGKLAVRIGVSEWSLRNLANLNRIPYTRAGTYRLFAEADLPTIRQVCIEAGYLKEVEREVARV
jgi:DNA-binding transcriptional MerR regulator